MRHLLDLKEGSFGQQAAAKGQQRPKPRPRTRTEHGACDSQAPSRREKGTGGERGNAGGIAFQVEACGADRCAVTR